MKEINGMLMKNYFECPSTKIFIIFIIFQHFHDAPFFFRWESRESSQLSQSRVLLTCPPSELFTQIFLSLSLWAILLVECTLQVIFMLKLEQNFLPSPHSNVCKKWENEKIWSKSRARLKRVEKIQYFIWKMRLKFAQPQ